MGRWMGLDKHPDSATAVVLDEAGVVVKTCHVHGQEQWEAFLAREIDGDTHVVLEASGGVWRARDQLLAAGAAEVLVAHPVRTKAIAAARVKTDKVDARTLADLGRAGLVASVVPPTQQERVIRSLVARRVALTRVTTAQKNQVYAALVREGIRRPKKDLFTVEGRTFLAEVSLPEPAQFVVQGALQILDLATAQAQAVEAEIAKAVQQGDPGFRADVERLLTIPGVGLLTAAAVRARLGDVRRFPSGRHVASYVGLAPVVRNSGNTVYTGSITKQGNTALRRLLVEAAWRVVRFDPRFQALFARLAPRKGKGVAIVAVARRLLVAMYAMLRDRTAYRWAKPKLTRTKLQQLARVRGGYLEALHAAVRVQRPEIELLHAAAGT